MYKFMKNEGDIKLLPLFEHQQQWICVGQQFSIISMEEKKTQIKEYLRNVVTPFLTPLMEEIVRERPSDLPDFSLNYMNKLIQKRKQINPPSDSENSSNQEEKEETDKRFLAKLKENKKKNRISRQGISAEVYGQFNKKEENFIPRVIEKDEATANSIRELVKKSILFQSLSQNDICILVNAMTIENFSSADSVIREKQKGQTLYVVGSGQYECSKIINGKQIYLKTYHQGQSFGQLAMMYNAPRAASIKCTKDGILYGLDRLTFKNIVEEAANRRRQKFREILSKISILSEIDPYEREQLCDILKQEEYNCGDYIVREGDQGDKFYMIVKGKLIAEKQTKKVFEFGDGDYFGEIALVRGTPRQASVKCQTDCRVVSIERDAFKRMFGPIEEILKRNEEKYKKYIAA